MLGFSRGRILVSFLIESLLLSLTGGLLGCLLALSLTHFRTGVGNMITFREISFEFRVDLAAVLAGRRIRSLDVRTRWFLPRSGGGAPGNHRCLEGSLITEVFS